MATSVINALKSKVLYTPTLGRDTITNVSDNYATKSGCMVHVRCSFKLASHSQTGYNSYIEMSGAKPFGSSVHGEFGMWTDMSTGEAGILTGSDNHNLWFIQNGSPVSLESRIGHTLWVYFVYSVE